jgi:Peptidase family M23
MFVLLLMLPGALAHASAAPQPTWHWPLRGTVVGSFHLTPVAPFARGQRRGIDVAATAGSMVRAACPGRVTFAGGVPRFGLAVSVRCGVLVATYLRLGHLSARRGARVGVGAPLGTLGPSGLLRLGARRASDRRGYLDPLSLLRDPRPAAPHVLAAPRRRHPRLPDPHPAAPRAFAAPPHSSVPHPARPRVRVAPRAARGPAAVADPRPAAVAAPRPAAPEAPPHAAALPWLAYPALALLASALPLGGLVQRRRRRARSLAPATADRA